MRAMRDFLFDSNLCSGNVVGEIKLVLFRPIYIVILLMNSFVTYEESTVIIECIILSYNSIMFIWNNKMN